METTATTTPPPSSSDEDISKFLLELHKELKDQQLGNAKQELTKYRQKNTSISANAVMNWIAPRIFQSPPASSLSQSQMEVVDEIDHDSYLQILLFMVQADPSTYLTVASSCIAHAALQISQDGTRPMVVSDTLRHVLVQQMTGSESAQVRTDATNTIISCTRKLGPSTVLLPAITEFVEDCWKKQLLPGNSSSNNKQQSSTIAVRCASSMVELWIALGDVAMVAGAGTSSSTSASDTVGAKELIVKMLEDESDPLVQLSILDLLEHLSTDLFKTPSATTSTSSSSGATSTTSAFAIRDWLVSPSIVQPLCKMCGVPPDVLSKDDPTEDEKMITAEDEPEAIIDPLLGGAALKLLSALCGIYHSMAAVTNNDTEQQGVHQHQQWLFRAFYRALHEFSSQHHESSSRTDEGERLALVQAISNFASSSNQAMQTIIDDPMTRDAWLSIHQVSKPKLQAAILVSVAMVLDPTLANARSAAPLTNNDNIPQQQQAKSINPTLTRNLYNMLGYVNTNNQSNAGTTNWLINTKARSPFSEVRRATYAVLSSVATTGPTGVMSLVQVDGGWRALQEFLLNRDVESDQDGRQARFEIVQSVFKNAPPGLLDASLMNKLSKHIEQGPHYVKPLPWDVAAE